MPTRRLTPVPSVPALVRVAMLGALSVPGIACGDDGDGNDAGTGNSSDVAPTAGPCFHDGGNLPECQTTGGVDDGGSGTGSGSASTSMTGPGESGFDDAPTAGPCFHDGGDLPECQTTGTADDTGSSDDSGGSGSGSGSGGSESSGTSSGG